jgi:hypothetical protein
MYPHAITGTQAANNGRVIMLPAYSFLLGLIALLGFMALILE